MVKSSAPRSSRKLAAATVKSLDNLASLAAVMREAKQASSKGALASRPEGAFTAAEYCEFHGIKKTTGSSALQQLTKDGKYEVIIAYHPDSRGHVTPTNFYRPKSK